MAKFNEKIRAIKLRKRGYGLNEIAQILNVSKGITSIWCRDIILNSKQLKKLRDKQKICGLVGRIKGAKQQQRRRLDKIDKFAKQAKGEISHLTNRDIFIAGIALYCGEGCKSGNKVIFSNSDPRIIKFVIKWFRDVFGVKKNLFRFQIGVNYIHQEREFKIRQYWSKIVNCPLEQFTKTSFKKVTNKKQYKNFNNHFGTLRLSVKRSSELQYKILGLMNALYENASVAQW